MDNLIYERKHIDNGFKLVAGVDEVGRGPLAGPVVCSAVIMDLDNIIEGVRDSKKLSEKKREQLFEEYLKTAIEKALVDEINNLSDEDKVILLVKLLDKKSADSNTLNGCGVNDFVNEIRNLMKQGIEL